MTTPWRLILDGPVDGALNMALDRAAQLAREEGSAPPTLRLYRWSRPTVTLGRFQPLESVDTQWCASHGVDVVRRFTGGRGVLHDDEITYAVTASIEDGLPRGVAASYRYLCAPLAQAYRSLGVRAELVAHDRTDSSSAACYLSTTRADLSVGVLKLSGSAQVWSGSTVLQHGSFVRSRDVSAEASAFRLGEAAAARLAADTITLETALGEPPSKGSIVDAVCHAFEDALGVSLLVGGWSAREAEIASELVGVSRITEGDQQPA